MSLQAVRHQRNNRNANRYVNFASDSDSEALGRLDSLAEEALREGAHWTVLEALYSDLIDLIRTTDDAGVIGGALTTLRWLRQLIGD
jgi:hypothetical protein